MKCFACHNQMKKKAITVDLRVGSKLLIIERVPATVCEHCGEKVFTLAIARKLQDLGRRRTKPRRVRKIPVFTMKESAL